MGTNYIKRVIAVSVFIMVVLLALFKTYDILRWKDTNGDYRSSVEQLYNTNDDLIDVVFVGSSHVYNGINPCIIWKKSGVAAFDMAVSGQDKYSSYHFLREVLKSQSPKLVCVDIAGLLFDKGTVEGNVYRNMLSMRMSTNSLNLIKDYFDDSDIREKGNYILRWPIIHTRYRELRKYDFVDNKINTFARGEAISFKTGNITKPLEDILDCAPEELSDTNYEWLQNLYALSREYNFELCLFVTPCAVDQSSQAIFNGAAKYAANHNIYFYDFNKMSDELGLDYSSDFADSHHLCYLGATKLSEYFSDNVLPGFGLTDHRDDPAYYQWDEDLVYYQDQLLKYKLEHANDINEFISLLTTNNNYTVLLSLEHDITKAETDYAKAFKKLGIDENESIVGGKWLYQSGKAYRIAYNVIDSAPFIKELSRHDTLTVRFNGYGYEKNLMINDTDYSNIGDYVSIVIYDNSLEKVTVHRFF